MKKKTNTVGYFAFSTWHVNARKSEARVEYVNSRKGEARVGSFWTWWALCELWTAQCSALLMVSLGESFKILRQTPGRTASLVQVHFGTCRKLLFSLAGNRNSWLLFLHLSTRERETFQQEKGTETEEERERETNIFVCRPWVCKPSGLSESPCRRCHLRRCCCCRCRTGQHPRHSKVWSRSLDAGSIPLFKWAQKQTNTTSFAEHCGRGCCRFRRGRSARRCASFCASTRSGTTRWRKSANSTSCCVNYASTRASRSSRGNTSRTSSNSALIRRRSLTPRRMRRRRGQQQRALLEPQQRRQRRLLASPGPVLFTWRMNFSRRWMNSSATKAQLPSLPFCTCRAPREIKCITPGTYNSWTWWRTPCPRLC